MNGARIPFRSHEASAPEGRRRSVIAWGYRTSALQASGNEGQRRAFTLFELILALALSATLLALIGLAINLYLKRVDSGRTRVEEAQLARSILTMIADDLRAAAVYQPQDTSGVETLMAAGSSFDVDSIDAARSGSSSNDSSDSGLATPSTPSTPGTATSLSGAGGSGTSNSTSGSSGGVSSSGSSGATSSEEQEEMPLGVNGLVSDLYIDTERLPRGDELFNTFTGYSNAPMANQSGSLLPSSSGSQSANLSHPSNLKTIGYFVRAGQRSGSGLAATSLSAEAQMQGGGLVRQEIPRTARLMAEEMADASILDSGQVLVAPEVVHLELKYYDGQQIVTTWDMTEMKKLPLAVEVRIWLASPQSLDTAGSAEYDAADSLATAREYRQTVFLPMAELSGSDGGDGGMGGTTSGSSSTSSTSGSTSFGSGTSNGQ